ncbi:hypothetical protein B0F90DRAFT_1218171 [Multifurca ochricompacta]|uniref:Secreted protein n=1 Tax=Multifurca ochricompacta TaxID=376703 RepID=A0AAD4LYQ4_9AGAM|nr:hypothetical protein B0F90DRAFT_1218171 [Multifurca ochricompacta]
MHITTPMWMILSSGCYLTCCQSRASPSDARTSGAVIRPRIDTIFSGLCYPLQLQVPDTCITYTASPHGKCAIVEGWKFSPPHFFSCTSWLPLVVMK